MTKKLAISNVHQFIGLAKKNPAVLNVGGFAFLRSFVDAKAGCGKCSAKADGINELRPQWEAVFSVLSAREQTQLKNLLDTEQICYYTRTVNGQLKPTCF